MEERTSLDSGLKKLEELVPQNIFYPSEKNIRSLFGTIVYISNCREACVFLDFLKRKEKIKDQFIDKIAIAVDDDLEALAFITKNHEAIFHFDELYPLDRIISANVARFDELWGLKYSDSVEKELSKVDTEEDFWVFDWD